MSNNQPNDQKLANGSEKSTEKSTKPGLNAQSAGMLDHDALHIVHKHHHLLHHHPHLNHVELHGNDDGGKVKPAEQHKIKAGESLSQIAKDAIGSHATKREIYDLVDKIVDANKGNKAVKSRDLISADGMLTIPEITTHSQAPVERPPAPPPRRQEAPRPAEPARPEHAPIRTDAPPDSRVAGPTDIKPGQPAQPPDAPRPVAPPPEVSAPIPPKTPGDTTNPPVPAPVAGLTDAQATQTKADADAIRKATGNDNTIWKFADKDAINKILEGKSDAQRQAIDAQYKKDHGVTLDQEMSKFESGADLEKFRNILNRQDGNGNNENARRLHEDLSELNGGGRSQKEIEKDIRDTLSSHNSDQIKAMQAEYTKAFPGENLHDAIMKDPTMSQTTKDMANIYLNHDEKNAAQESKQLIDIALKGNNAEAFNEVMKNASPDVRADFLKNGGAQKINDAFGHWYSDADARHALDYAREGKLDAATQIADNTHLINNSKGIELAIKQMTPDERTMYQNGKTIADGKPVANLSADDQTKAKAYYDNLHTAMTSASGATDVAKWEDEISTAGKGSFVSSLASDNHWYGNSGIDTIQQQMRTMSASDWQDCKQNPARRDELATMLGSLGKSKDEINQTLGQYDKIMAADTYDHATDQAKQSVLTTIDSNKHWYGNNRDGVLDSVANMSQADQNSYRTDADFRKKVDDAVKGSIEDIDGQDAAQRMLDAIKNGKSPKSDIITNLERLQNYDGSKTTEAVKDITEAMKNDPTLKDRITNPKTEDDKKFAAQFKTAVQNAFGDDYDNFGKPLVETGTLPLDMKMHLSQGVFSNDNNQIYSDIASATPAERLRLQNDATYQQQTIGFLSKDRQAVALAVAAQGEQRPEDKIRDAAVGMGGSSDIVATLKSIKPQDLANVEQEYARKYGSSLEGDLAKKLSGTDKDEAERVFTQNLSQESKVNIAKDQTESTRSGFGAAVADNVWHSGTGAQADNAQDQTMAALTEKNKMDKAIADGNGLAANMTPEQQQALQTQLAANIDRAVSLQNEATDNHREAKAAAAEYVSDGAIAAVAIGSMIVTGGADAPLVLALAAAGGVIKVGTNATLEGNDYDWSAGHVAEDAAIGAVTAATSVIGPGEVAAVLGIGKQAAEESALVAIEAVGTTALREGGETILKDGTKDIVREALSSGAKKLDAKAFTALAEKAISPEITGTAREAAVAHLSSTLESEVSSRMAQGVVRRATQQGLNMAGGGLGGGAGGLAQGATQWDSRDTLSANLGRTFQAGLDGTISGAIGGGVMTAGMEGLGTSFRALRGTVSRESTVVADEVARTTETAANKSADSALTEAETTEKLALLEAYADKKYGGPVKLDEGKLTLADNSSSSTTHAEVRAGQLAHADGTSEPVFFHASEATPEATAERLAKEQAAFKLNQLFYFKGKYPESEAITSQITGHPSEGWLQEAAGEPLQQELRKRAVAQFGTTTNLDQDVSKILAADPKFAQQVQEAVVERLIYGDGDIAARNMGVSERGIKNFDLGEGFRTNSVPELKTPQNDLTSIGLQNALSGQDLSPRVRYKLTDFLAEYDNPAGAESLKRVTGLSDEQVHAVLDRTRSLADSGKLPDVNPKVNAPDNISIARAAEQADAGLKDPAVKTNSDGRVTRVKTEQGTTSIDYLKGDNAGEVKSVKLADGTKYTSKDGENWTITGDQGKTTAKGKISVTKDGVVSFKSEAGVETTYNIDGSQARVDESGNKVFTQKDGKVSSVTDPRGKVALFDYAADGQLTKVKHSDGTTMERVGDLTKNDKEQWLVVDRSSPQGRIVEGQKTILPEGKVEIKNANGTEVFGPDGSQIVRNARNNVTKTIDANGGKTVYTYDAAGEMNGVEGRELSAKRMPALETDAEGRITSVTRLPFGAKIHVDYDAIGNGEIKQTVTVGYDKYSSVDGKHWQLGSLEDAAKSEDWNGQVKVGKDGTLTIKEEGSTKSDVYRPDGVTVRYDGYQIESVSGGQDNYTRTAAGKWEKNSGSGFAQPVEGNIKETPEGLFFEAKGSKVPEPISNKESWLVDRGKNTKTETQGAITVDENGKLKIPVNYYDEIRTLDTRLEYRDRALDKTISGRDAAGNPLKAQDVVRDEFHQSVHDRFEQLSSTEQINRGVDRVKAELGDVRAIGADGKETSVLDSLMKESNLSEQQKANVLRNLAEVREHFASYRAGDRMHPDPEVNWIHTQGELGRVLESARANKLTPNQMEDAMLASMYSDSVKFAFPPPKDASANFFTHHLDGAVAAQEALTKQGFPKERVDSIVQAIKEHQISPPEFMGQLYYMRMKGAIDGLEAGKTLPPEKIAELRSTLAGMSSQVGDKPAISAIAHVNDVPKVQGADGNFEVALTDQQKEVLKLAGIDKWSVPTDPIERPGFKQLPKAEQDRLVSQYKISQTLIDGDAIDNYATLGGASKIVALRRPGSMFQDATVWKSIASVDDSFKDAHNVLSANGKRVADESLAARNRVLNDETTGIKAQLDTWLKSKGLDPATDKIPFYNTDLKFPKPLTAEEKALLAAGTKADGTALTAAERKGLEFKGLDNKQIEQYKTAQEISDHMRDLLRQANRLDGTLPGTFDQAALKPAAGDWALAKPSKFELPPTTEVTSNPDGSWQGKTADHRTVFVAKNGDTTVTDTASATSHTYGKDGRLLRSVDSNNDTKFHYDSQGNLADIRYKDGTSVYSDDGQTWMRSKLENGKLQTEQILKGKVDVDPEGNIKYINDDGSSMQVERPDGSVEEHLRNGRVDWIKADLPTETAKLNELTAKNFANPKQLERVQKLISEFDKEAEVRGFDDNKKALFFKQMNRLLEDDPHSAIPQAERAALAEQVLNHTVHPTGVDQGGNSTCNVTTLEVRNYVRDPEKNAQIIADVAHTGKFITTEGKTIDLSQLEAGIHPDAEARTNLKLQNKGEAKIKGDGSRDWASQILELSMVNTKWQGDSHMILNNTDMTNWNLAFDGDHKLIGGINKTSDVTLLYGKDGKQIYRLNPTDTAYTKAGKPIENLDRSKLIYDPNGYVRGLTDDANLTKVFDAAGGKLQKLDEGAHGYDANGKEIFKVTSPGDIVYDKKINSVSEKERVLIKDGDTWTPLKDPTDGVIDSPVIYGSELEGINESVTNVRDNAYVIERNSVKSIEDLEKRLTELKENNDFPAVIGVYTSRRPFSSTYGLESAWAGGGYHVVDIHDYDPITKTVKFSNQWGSRFDHMDKGVSLESVYNGMKPNSMTKYLEDHKVMRGFYRTGLGLATAGLFYEGIGLAKTTMDSIRNSNPPVYAPTPYRSPYATPQGTPSSDQSQKEDQEQAPSAN